MKLDLLVFASHPDDAEIGCSGTILSFTSRGKKVGIVDLTRGELGTRGTAEDRQKEAGESAKLLGVVVRENLGLPDGFLREDQDTLLKLIQVIRKYKPGLVLANALYDRHPDHGNGGAIASTACFLSGLTKIETDLQGKKQDTWRPVNIYHYIQDRHIRPDFVVDISPFWATKLQSIRAFKSQFFSPDSQEPETYISKPEFLTFLESRSREFGHSIGVEFGEGFSTDRKRLIGLRNLEELI